VRWRTIKTVLQAGYVDAYRTCHPGRPGFTMPSWEPHVRLDYAFVPAPSARCLISCDVAHHADAAAASDHLPVIAEFEI
jgi:exonuclease III